MDIDLQILGLRRSGMCEGKCKSHRCPIVQEAMQGGLIVDQAAQHGLARDLPAQGEAGESVSPLRSQLPLNANPVAGRARQHGRAPLPCLAGPGPASRRGEPGPYKYRFFTCWGSRSVKMTQADS